jgi:hypothetical protein
LLGYGSPGRNTYEHSFKCTGSSYLCKIQLMVFKL